MTDVRSYAQGPAHAQNHSLSNRQAGGRGVGNNYASTSGLMGVSVPWEVQWAWVLVVLL